ncbi:SMP-30/gluconolactonase/LRE family protein, partial [Streptomyces rubiginosohelvolus]
MRRFPMRPLAVLATVGTLVLTGCGTETGAPGGRVSSERTSGEQVAADGASVDGASAGRASGDRAGRTIRAQKVMQLTRTHPETGMTLLEGPVLDENGRLYVVDVTAPEGMPKVMRVDVRNKTFRAVSTEGRAAYTSAQFSPYDGRLYLTDFAHGEIVSMAADGSDRRTFFSGGIDGAPMNPDDLAFDRDGHLYISDSRGLSEGTAQGRVVRISRDGEDVDVLARDLAAPNGISFDEEYRGLWFSELTENRISYLRL